MSIVEIVSLVAMVLVGGGVASYAVQYIKRASWSTRVKWFLSVAISIVFGLATVWLAGDVLGLISAWGELTAAEVFAVIAAVYAAASGFYALWVKPKSAA